MRILSFGFIIFLNVFPVSSQLLCPSDFERLVLKKTSRLLDFTAVHSTSGTLGDIAANWIRRRIKGHTTYWTELFAPQASKNIVAFPGFLTHDWGLNFRLGLIKNQPRGPMGELVQWSDVLAALISLGHDVKLTSEVRYAESV